MAMGRRPKQRQSQLWVEAKHMAKGPGPPFYGRLNQIPAKYNFDCFVEGVCRVFYDAALGRPSLPPAVYFVSC
jgi:hypothetical protein